MPTVPPCRSMNAMSYPTSIWIARVADTVHSLKLTAIQKAPEDRPLFLPQKETKFAFQKFLFQVNLRLREGKFTLTLFFLGEDAPGMMLFYVKTSLFRKPARYLWVISTLILNLSPPWHLGKNAPGRPAESIRCHTETAPSKILGSRGIFWWQLTWKKCTKPSSKCKLWKIRIGKWKLLKQILTKPSYHVFLEVWMSCHFSVNVHFDQCINWSALPF